MIGTQTMVGYVRRVLVRAALLLGAAGAACMSQPREPLLTQPASAPSVAFGDLRPEADRELEHRTAQTAAVGPRVDSNLASVFNGGGCRRAARLQGLDQLILVDPE